MIMEGKIIDAGKLLCAIRDDPSINGANFARIKRHISEATAVDAVEVVHGRWIFGTTNNHEWMKCSECLKSQTLNGCFTYCPNCGAKMDGDGNG